MKFKFKNTLLVSFLAIAGILGVSSALINHNVGEPTVEAKADDSKTIYFKDAAWWTTDMVYTYMYVWKSSDETVNNGWPGVKMTAPDDISTSGSNIYSANLDTTKGYDRFIFSRSNDTKIDAQTVDITIDNSNNLYDISGTSAAWIGQGNKVSGGTWNTQGKSSFYLIGEGSFASSKWATAGGIRMDQNPNNASDKGMILHQYLTAGDAFNISNGSTTYNYTNIDSTSLKYPSFTRGINGKLQTTVKADGSNNPYYEWWNTYSSGTSVTPEDEQAYFYVYVDGPSWYETSPGRPTLQLNYEGSGEYPYFEKTTKSGHLYTYRFWVNDYTRMQVFRNYDSGTQAWSGWQTYTERFNYITYNDAKTYKPIYVKTSGYYDIYLTSSGSIYIKNSEDTSLGYLYLSTTTSYDTSSYDYHIYAWYTQDNTDYKIFGDWPGLNIDYLYGHKTSNLSFNSKGNLIRIPMSLFKGASYYIINVCNKGTTTVAKQSNDLNVPTINGTNYYHYVDASKNSSPSSSDGTAARAAYDIAEGIKGCTNASICTMTQSIATSLLTEYNAASSNSKLTGCYIKTWSNSNSSWQRGDNMYERVAAGTLIYKYNVPMSSIYNQLVNISTTGHPGWAAFKGWNIFGDENFGGTLIIIIASSVALLSVTALSILVIRKRKTKEQ